MPHKYGHSSNSGKGEPRFYHVDFDEDNFHIKYMCRKLNREIFKKNHLVIRAYANLQFRGMDGSFHFDDGDFTVLYMVTPTLKGSGQFEYIDGDSVKKIDFVQNRLFWFAGSELKHRGTAPDTDSPRVTLSFKVNREIG
tara:strand:- start:45 stop:461 length:417 start_codon:yes stop_codon:yes gene_type:complete